MADYLKFFGPDGPSAEAAVADAREKLISYFTWRGFSNAEDLAHEVIRRGIAKLSSGTTLERDGPMPFLYGIAQLVLYEAGRTARRRTSEEPVEDHPARHTVETSRDDIILLRELLETLSRRDRDVITRYYGDPKGRAELARELGKSPAALRVQVHKIRQRLTKLRDHK
jgi:RNA polymerase sigma factor (sigma-70 family)